MAKVMKPGTATGLVFEHFDSWLRQRAHVDTLDTWARGEQDTDELYVPSEVERTTGSEYMDLAKRSPAPWLPLVTTSLLQTIYLKGMYRSTGDAEAQRLPFDSWQRNAMDSKQIPLYRGAMDHGFSFLKIAPGRDRLTGQTRPIWTPRSARRMAAFYEDVFEEFPLYTIEAERTKIDINGREDIGYAVTLTDDIAEYRFLCRGEGLELRDWSYIDYAEHGAPVCPVVQYAFQTDLDGRPMGQIEPLIPLARRIDQDTFDRLIVQRFGAWKVRYVTGMAKPKDMPMEEYRAELIKLRVGDFLVAPGTDQKFGTLDESDIKAFIAAGDADLRTLSAVSQTPPHHMLGLSSNMQAESLAAAEAGLRAKSVTFRTHAGESHERAVRLDAIIRGDRDLAAAYDLQSEWKDMETRSMSQAADALGKFATQVGVPQEMLFEMIPNWTQYDVQRALGLVESGAMDRFIEELQGQQGNGQELTI